MSELSIAETGPCGQPLTISVITVCRNAAQTIETTIQSVLWQDYPHVEYVIVDGLSTDGTWEVVQRYRDRITVAVHESDTGTYNAMNKALRLFDGDIITFMNANDYFVSPFVLGRVAEVFTRQPELDVVYGDFIADSGAAQQAQAQVERIDRRFFLQSLNLSHQSMFCRRRAFERVGIFDESLRIMADRDWNIRALVIHRLAYRHIPLVVCAFDTNGACNTNPVQSAAELETIMRRYFGGPELAYWRAMQRWTLLRDRTLFRLKHHDVRPPRFVRDLFARRKD